MADPSSFADLDVAASSVEPDPLKGGDVHQWSVDQAALIRARRFDAVDWINVADEIESVGKSEFRAFTSNLEILLVHLLIWDHQPRRRSRSWLRSIKEHRRRVEEDFEDSPSLRARRDEAVARAYRRACYAAEMETGLSGKRFAPSCPYDWTAIMTRSLVLDQTDERG